MSLKVLLADSSGLLKEVLSFSMAEKQIEFVAVETGTDALLQVKELYPDVLLADVSLSGVDGYNLCEMVKSDSGLSSRVILLFDSLVPLDIGRAEAAGYDHALKKPFNAENLFSLFEEWGFKGIPDEGIEVTEEPDIDEDMIITEDFAAGAKGKGEKEFPTEVELSPMPEIEEEDEKASLFEMEAERYSDDEGAKDPFNPEEVFEVTDRDALLESSEGILSNSVSLSDQVALGQEEEPEIRYAAGAVSPGRAVDTDVSSAKGKELLQEIVKTLSDDVVREVAWEVVPDLAERMIKEAISKITKR